ncbi:hypothetical protein Hdeb2414_s0190g00828181 [Helianthus debilis subsp. tardiflorus]
MEGLGGIGLICENFEGSPTNFPGSSMVGHFERSCFAETYPHGTKECSW